MLIHETLNVTHLRRWYPAIACQSHRIKPKFTFALWTSHMNVRRLIRFIGIKMKSVGAYSQDGWHLRKIQSLLKRDLQCLQQFLARRLLTINSGDLFDPTDPPGTGLLNDGGIGGLHDRMIPRAVHSWEADCARTSSRHALRCSKGVPPGVTPQTPNQTRARTA